MSLWISQVARSVADNFLAMVVVLQLSDFSLEQSSLAWHLGFALLAPAVLLAPVNGALCNSLPKHWILAGSATFSLCMTTLFGIFSAAESDPWLWTSGLGLITIGRQAYSPVCYALLAAACEESHLPLSRVIGWVEAGNRAGMAAGLFLGWYLHAVSWTQSMPALAGETSLFARAGHGDLPVALVAALGLNLLAVLAALPVHFPSDVRRPERMGQALAGFVRDSRMILKEAAARGSLLALAGLFFLVTVGSGMVLSVAGTDSEVNWTQNASAVLVFVSAGVAVGALLAGTQGHPRRILGLVPPAACGALAVLWTIIRWDVPNAYLALGLMAGFMIVPLRTAYLIALPADARGNGMALMNALTGLSIAAALLFTLSSPRLGMLTPGIKLWLLIGLAVASVFVAWWILLRETIEQLGEILLWPMYRLGVAGPGQYQIPLRGPLLVVANHTAWFDPLWLAKVLPRQLTPMMTSRFFDLPVLHWLMRNVAGAIRVPAAGFRREAPELQEAVSVLDRGDCLLIFPEGSMRRAADQSLRHFGQGVWRILQQRPETPVVVCWIEGGWGSFTSYCGGPPATHKHLDWWRQIQIAIERPQILDPDLLADQHATRDYLRRACLKARRYLGVEHEEV
jgi:1-acyl-sn-glycerol-3-phosphate acyltransferase